MKRRLARLAVVPFALLWLASIGCGPFTVPGVHRLPPEEQAGFEDMWANMLAPPDRLDRELLLDTICAYQMFQVGVDRLTMRSEKDVPGGKVVMVVRYDRRDPSADTFAVDLHDRRGAVVRSERYSQAEVFARAPAAGRCQSASVLREPSRTPDPRTRSRPRPRKSGPPGRLTSDGRRVSSPRPNPVPGPAGRRPIPPARRGPNLIPAGGARPTPCPTTPTRTPPPSGTASPRGGPTGSARGTTSSSG